MANAMRRFGLVVALSVGVATSASGQGRGFSAPARGFSAPMRGSPARASSVPMHGPAGRSFSGLGRGFPRAGHVPRGTFGPGTCGVFTPCSPPFFLPPVTATPLEPNFGVINGVPGLGFDFPHLAAINRGFNNQFGFFNAFNNGFFDNGFGFIPFFGSLPSYYPPYEEETPYYAEGAQQPIFVVPQPQPNTSVPAETAPRQDATPQTLPPPPPELGQLILVRSDGEVLLAVAFTVSKGRLTYITNEGTKRSFPVSELDKQATQQMNDANGTSVSLPE